MLKIYYYILKNIAYALHYTYVYCFIVNINENSVTENVYKYSKKMLIISNEHFMCGYWLTFHNISTEPMTKQTMQRRYNNCIALL